MAVFERCKKVEEKSDREMNKDRINIGTEEIDSELEALWREGIDSESYEEIIRKLNESSKIELPQGLREKLLKIPSGYADFQEKERAFPSAYVLRFATFSVAVCVLFFSGYYLSSRYFLFKESSSMERARAESFIEDLIDDGQSFDVFDRDVLLLEHLS